MPNDHADSETRQSLPGDYLKTIAALLISAQNANERYTNVHTDQLRTPWISLVGCSVGPQGCSVSDLFYESLQNGVLQLFVSNKAIPNVLACHSYGKEVYCSVASVDYLSFMFNEGLSRLYELDFLLVLDTFSDPELIWVPLRASLP